MNRQKSSSVPAEERYIQQHLMLDEAQPANSPRTEHTQRIQVEPIGYCGKRVKIIVESYDEGLGWYTSGSLTLPIDQLPLLEQGIQEMRIRSRSLQFAKIIEFPKGDLEQTA